MIIHFINKDNRAQITSWERNWDIVEEMEIQNDRALGLDTFIAVSLKAVFKNTSINLGHGGNAT